LEDLLRTLIFGYGNYDRQDDGAAWHVISLLRKALSIPDHESIDDDFISDDDLIFVFQLQLTPNSRNRSLSSIAFVSSMPIPALCRKMSTMKCFTLLIIILH